MYIFLPFNVAVTKTSLKDFISRNTVHVSGYKRSGCKSVESVQSFHIFCTSVMFGNQVDCVIQGGVHMNVFNSNFFFFFKEQPLKCQISIALL